MSTKISENQLKLLDEPKELRKKKRKRTVKTDDITERPVRAKTSWELAKDDVGMSERVAAVKARRDNSDLLKSNVEKLTTKSAAKEAMQSKMKEALELLK
eukprot:TRINITY_DN17425_c0_g1_i1.p1 TRINITY_DN17425_c0_g1~~TRINITY_DN17425_c0_g1_i1.p1  ORF type:complete len:100 (+),score=36.18 TRINITY_DN17425_c0_g1_i1:37-336(+)